MSVTQSKITAGWSLAGFVPYLLNQTSTLPWATYTTALSADVNVFSQWDLASTGTPTGVLKGAGVMMNVMGTFSNITIPNYNVTIYLGGETFSAGMSFTIAATGVRDTGHAWYRANCHPSGG